MKKNLFVLGAMLAVACGGNGGAKEAAEAENVIPTESITITVNLKGFEGVEAGSVVELLGSEQDKGVKFSLDEDLGFSADVDMVYGESFLIKSNDKNVVSFSPESDDVVVAYNAESDSFDVKGTDLYAKYLAFADRVTELIDALYASQSEEEAEANYTKFLAYALV